MLRFVLWRVAQFPLILAVIYLLTFLLAWVAPGDPFEGERKLDPIAKRQLQQQFHAENWYTFLAYYPRNMVVNGDLGPSLFYKEWSVNDILGASLPVSLTLGVFAITVAATSCSKWIVSGQAINTSPLPRVPS